MMIGDGEEEGAIQKSFIVGKVRCVWWTVSNKWICSLVKLG